VRVFQVIFILYCSTLLVSEVESFVDVRVHSCVIPLKMTVCKSMVDLACGVVKLLVTSEQSLHAEVLSTAG